DSEPVKHYSLPTRRSSDLDLKNTPLVIQDKQYKLNQLASIEKMKTGNSIRKVNQQYHLTVAYDFLGTEPLAKKVRESNIEELKRSEEHTSELQSRENLVCR